MRVVENLFIWAGGYAPRTLADEKPEDREPIAKIGGTVILAAVIAAANWGIAGHTYASGLTEDSRLLAAVVGGLVGITIVLVIDRTGLFYFDIMDRGPFFAGLWLSVRAALIVAVSALTAQAVIPAWLRSELHVHALQLRESSDARRLSHLTGQFGLREKQAAFAKASDGLLWAEQQTKVVPPEIQQRLVQARRCWSDYRTRKRLLERAGIAESVARSQLEPAVAVCVRNARAAESEKQAHDAKMRVLVDEAAVKKQEASLDFFAAKAAIERRLEEARMVEGQGVNALSASVLRSLLESDPASRLKLIILVAFLTTMEMLPLLTKLLAGKSIVGLRLATGRAIERFVQQERIAASRNDMDVAVAINGAMKVAMTEACSNPDVRQFCVKLFGTKLRAFVPLEVVRAVLHDIETRQSDVTATMRRFPKYAGAISEAWSHTVREAVELIKANDFVENKSVQPFGKGHTVAGRQHSYV